MKNLLYVFGIVAALFMTTSATCTKEPELNDFNCKCTYVPAASGPTSGEPNKEETTTVKGKSSGEAKVECAKLNGKYSAQYFSGSCLLQ